MNKPITIPEAAAAIRSGRIKPIELVDQCLAQIDRYEDRLHAWVLVERDGARRIAETLGAEAARGEFRGPLHGIPVGIKDIIDVAGFPTKAGSPLRKNHVAVADAPLVAALRAAGAIILGKTVTVQFACFDPSPSRNPWSPDLTHTPGGSSSGSAVAVAMGMCLGALGTQTGGSLVRPSTYCGIATCKPTFGLLSTDGIVPVSYYFDHPGPMARRVDDLIAMMACFVGRSFTASSRGAGCQPAVGEAGSSWGGSCTATPRNVRDVRGAAVQLPPQPEAPWQPAPRVRLGLLQQFFMEHADAAVRKVTESALEKLRQAGAEIVPVSLPGGFDDVRAIHRTVMAVEAAAYHRQQFAAHRAAYGPMIAGLLDEGLSISGVDYAAALAQQRAFRRRVASLFDGVDALIVPSTDTTAPHTLETTGTPKFQAPWSCAGVPVVSIPSGLADDGMPAAVQIVGPAGADAAVLEVARWCEEQIAFAARPAMWQDERGVQG